MDESEADVLTYITFRSSIGLSCTQQIRSNALNGEIKQRTEVVGTFQNEAAIANLVGAVLMEQNDETFVQRSRYLKLGNVKPIHDDPLVNLPSRQPDHLVPSQ